MLKDIAQWLDNYPNTTIEIRMNAFHDSLKVRMVDGHYKSEKSIPLIDIKCNPFEEECFYNLLCYLYFRILCLRKDEEYEKESGQKRKKKAVTL